MALSLEIVWFRLLDVAVKSTAFTFGTVLAVYLLGSAVGSLLGAPLVARVRRPLRAFLLAQCAILALAVLPVLLVVALPPDTRRFSWFVEYWAGYAFFPLGHDPDRATIARLYLLLPLALFFAPTVLMGLSFPILQRAVHDDPATSGRKVGALQAANIAGCTAGSLLVGLVGSSTSAPRERSGCWSSSGSCSPWWASATTAASSCSPRLACSSWRRPCRSAAPLAPAARRSRQRPARLLRGGRDERRGPHPGPGRLAAVGERERQQLAALRQRPHDARRAAGDRAPGARGRGRGRPRIRGHRLGRGLAARDPLAHGLRDLRPAAQDSPAPRRAGDVSDTRRLLEDPRLQIRIEDGRKALEAGEATYDLIETDATWPETAGSGNLYSVEFFAAASRRLKPGGVMCTWAPTPRVVASFRAVFPHVLEAEGGDVLIGSLTPMPTSSRRGRHGPGAPRRTSVRSARRTSWMRWGSSVPPGPRRASRPTGTSSPATSTR